MKLFISVILTASLFGCTPYPRYGAGGAPSAKPLADEQASFKTNDVLKLGMIMQMYLGKPYKGTSKFIDGVDCSLFTQQVFREFNQTSLPRTAAEQFAVGVEAPRRTLEFGDLVFFITERDKVSHVGIYIGANQFMHATDSYGVIISSLNENYWVKRFVGARRILGVNTVNPDREKRVRTGYGRADG